MRIRRSGWRAPVNRRAARIATTVTTCLAALIAPLAAAPAAHATSCSGKTYTWTAKGDGRSWSDAQNWSPSDGTPSTDDIVNITADSSTGEVFVDDPQSVCDLTLTSTQAGPSDGWSLFFHADNSITVSNDFTVNGASDTFRAAWNGTINVGGTSTLNGFVEDDANSGASFPTGITVLNTANLVVAANANVLLTNGTTNLRVTNTADIGTSIIWSNGSSPSDDIAELEVLGAMSLSGDVDFEADLNLDTGSSLDLAGHTLDINSHSYSMWAETTVGSSGGAGTVKFRDGTWLLLDGINTLDSGATLHFQDDSRMSDGKSYEGIAPSHTGPKQAGTLNGTGNVEWVSGHLVGNVTLGQHITTTLDGDGTNEWHIEQQTGTLLTNDGRLVVANGDLDIPASPGQIVNNGALVLWTGVTVTGSAPTTDIVNNASGTVQVVTSALHPTAKTAVLEATLANHGTISVPAHLTLQFNNGREFALRSGGTITGGGTVDITDETSVLATGTTTITGGSTLLFNGDNSYIESGARTAKGVWTATAAFTTPKGKVGTLAWKQGQIDGHLALTGALAVNVTDPGDGADRFVGGDTDYDQTQLTFGSPTTISNAEVDIHNNAAVLVTGALTLAGKAPVLGNGYGNASDGAIIHVEGSGSITVAPATSTAHTAATMDFPVVNSGTLTVGLGSSLLLPTSFTQNGGALHGGGRLIGNIVVTGGNVRPSKPGSTPKTLTVQGTYHQGSHATLWLLVAGTASGKHDRLTVTGAATLAGTVEPVLKSGYHPGVGATFTGLTANPRSGKFGTVRSPGVPTGDHWSQRLYAKSVAFRLVR